ncbi:MAG: TIGR02757 family protein [Bacteroidetes bacterium]|nr:MAG: TIGR02757 family protein [Bacteroidota bacterium]
MTEELLKEFLEEKADKYNHPDFVQSDPIQIPHSFTRKEDIEISAFLVATIAWGNRKSIIRSGEKLMTVMGAAPYEYVMNYESGRKIDFVHRTFNATDLDFFFRSLKNLYEQGGLEKAFSVEEGAMKERIIAFREAFLSVEHEQRSEKHLSDPSRGSAAKRINMFLRWMVRKDGRGVDFGIWDTIPTSELMLPLDVHTGNISRKLGLLKRKQNDWKALEEIQESLRVFDPKDPARFDFALFGLGAFEDF